LLILLIYLFVAQEPESESKANITDDIGYDDISDDELDDLITGAEEEHEEKQPEKTGTSISYHIQAGFDFMAI